MISTREPRLSGRGFALGSAGVIVTAGGILAGGARPGGPGRYPAQRVAHAEREHPGRGGVQVQALARRVQSGDPRIISPVSFEARRGPLRAGTSPATPPAASAWSQRQTVAGSTPNADATCAWLAARSRTS